VPTIAHDRFNNSHDLWVPSQLTNIHSPACQVRHIHTPWATVHETYSAYLCETAWRIRRAKNGSKQSSRWHLVVPALSSLRRFCLNSRWPPGKLTPLSFNICPAMHREATRAQRFRSPFWGGCTLFNVRRCLHCPCLNSLPCNLGSCWTGARSVVLQRTRVPRRRRADPSALHRWRLPHVRGRNQQNGRQCRFRQVR